MPAETEYDCDSDADFDTVLSSVRVCDGVSLDFETDFDSSCELESLDVSEAESEASEEIESNVAERNWVNESLRVFSPETDRVRVSENVKVKERLSDGERSERVFSSDMDTDCDCRIEGEKVSLTDIEGVFSDEAE